MAEDALDTKEIDDELQEMGLTDGLKTWDDVRAIVKHISMEKGEYAGFPLPVPGYSLVLEDRYPYRQTYQEISDLRDQAPQISDDEYGYSCTTSDVDETLVVLNRWYSKAKRAYITLYLSEGRVKHYVDHRNRDAEKATLWLNTVGASVGWDPAAEATAQERLASMIPDHQFVMYAMTGTFLYRSDASRVTYLFRRLRPTLALVPVRHWVEDSPMKVLAALCLHPIGYYLGTWCGAMVPTDDVIAHLLMARSDEHLFWKRANHHALDSPEAGL